jgi:ABC-type dipeptide/oligopeptide/nickel transport system ATPase subunit
MAESNSPVHVIHALAGCGKSTVLQCLVALFAAAHAALLSFDLRPAAPSDSEADLEVLVFILRTRTLRHEFLQTLLHN